MGTATSPKEKLHSIVKASRTVLLLSHGDDHTIGGRPMALQRADEDSTIYLVTGIDSKKVSEIEADPRVTIAVQNREGIAMIAGNCRISRDRALIEELWENDWAVWFKGGKEDPSIAILIVEPEEATYWDQDVPHGLSYLYRYVKARVTHEEMETKPGDQQKVNLR